MAKAAEHERLIAAAAKTALMPLGCIRKGRSRTWYDDHGYWLIFVEFQPSAWTRGSYLNVGTQWLWKASHGYDHFYRPGDFIEYRSENQFRPLIEQMAEHAAKEVVALRQKLSSFDEVLILIKRLSRRDGWPVYNAAVACALAGDTASAQNFFDRMQAWSTNGSDWELALKKRSENLAMLLDKPAQLREKISAQIDERRAEMKLPPNPDRVDQFQTRAVSARS
jgi:hypothetical protein